MPNLPELTEALERGALALFIGADLPREVTSLPSRAELARELALRKRGALARVDQSLSLAEVAQRVSRAGKRWEFTAFIRDALDTAGRPPQPFHRRIVEIASTYRIETIITTAYDNLLELAFQEAGAGINRVVRGSDVSFVNPDRPTLVKLYGDAQQPDTLVVTDRDHSDLLRDRDREPLLDEVRRALRLNSVLFLGYNLADPDFRFLFDQIAESRFARIAYAVWPGLPEADVRMWRDRGIVILDTDPLGMLGEIAAQPVPHSRPEATITVPQDAKQSTRDTARIRQPAVDTLSVQSWSYQAGSGVAGVAVSANGSHILAGTLGKQVICLDQNGEALWSIEVGNQAWRVALSAGGETAIAGTGSTRPWDMKGRGLYTFDGDGLLRWQQDLGASVWGLALAADGRTVAVGTDGHEALLYDGEGHLLWRRKMPGVGWWAWVWAAALSADGQTAAVGAANKTMLVLDRGGNLLGKHDAGADVMAVSVSADGQTVAAGSTDQQVYLLDRQGHLLWSKKLGDKVWTVALPEDGQRLVVGAGEKEAHIRTFDRGGRPLWMRYVEGSVSRVAVSTGGEIIVVGTRAGHVTIFDGDGEPLHHHVAAKSIRDVAISADGQVAAAASEDGHVYGFLLLPRPLPLSGDRPVPSLQKKPAWDTATIRRLLTAAFDDEVLTVLCFDYFRPVYEGFGSGMSKGEKIQRLLDYCDRHGQLEKLLEHVRERNSDQYARFRDQLR